MSFSSHTVRRPDKMVSVESVTAKAKLCINPNSKDSFIRVYFTNRDGLETFLKLSDFTSRQLEAIEVAHDIISGIAKTKLERV